MKSIAPKIVSVEVSTPKSAAKTIFGAAKAGSQNGMSAAENLAAPILSAAKGTTAVAINPAAGKFGLRHAVLPTAIKSHQAESGRSLLRALQNEAVDSCFIVRVWIYFPLT